METLTANRHLTDKALATGRERAAILREARPLFASCTLEEIALRLGTSKANLSRLRDRFAHLADHELTAENLAGGFANAGRTSTWEELAADEQVRQALQQLYLLTIGSSSDYMTIGRRTGSMALTLERFGDHELCPAALRGQLRRGHQPVPLQRVVREINAGLEQMQRGTKHTALNNQLGTTRNGMEVMEDGTEVAIEFGDYWVFDDESDNQPFWFHGPDGQPLVGRQGLYGFDICGKWLGLELVGTYRDSYSAAIILRYFRRLFQALGKPRKGIILERSVWQAKTISGFRLTQTGKVIEDEFERPAMPFEEVKLLQDGLEALGIKIIYAHTPRGKEIEGAFNYLQRVLPTFAPQAVNIGRHAGEFEAGAKALRRAHAGSHLPHDLGFAYIDDRADLIEQAMQWIDAREVNGESNTVQYNRSLAASPLRPLTELDLTVFLPVYRPFDIRLGKVKATVDGEIYEFTHPELFASLGAGYRVFVRFDPAEPTMGAAIYNNESSSINHQNWQLGQFMGWAEFLPPVPRINNSDVLPKADELKKRFNGWHRNAFRAVGMPKAKAATLRDGKGAVKTAGSAEPMRVTAAGEQPVNGSTGAEPKPRIRKSLFAAATPEEFSRQQQKLARQAERARKLEQIINVAK